MNEKEIQGLLSANPEKRYKSFLSTVADRKEVWLLASNGGYTSFDTDGYIHLLVWPRREFAELFKSEGEKAVSMEIHEFLEQCANVEENVRFMIFPTNDSAYVVDSEKLIYDICTHLK